MSRAREYFRSKKYKDIVKEYKDSVLAQKARHNTGLAKESIKNLPKRLQPKLRETWLREELLANVKNDESNI